VTLVDSGPTKRRTYFSTHGSGAAVTENDCVGKKRELPKSESNRAGGIAGGGGNQQGRTMVSGMPGRKRA